MYFIIQIRFRLIFFMQAWPLFGMFVAEFRV